MLSNSPQALSVVSEPFRNSLFCYVVVKRKKKLRQKRKVIPQNKLQFHQKHFHKGLCQELILDEKQNSCSNKTIPSPFSELLLSTHFMWMCWPIQSLFRLSTPGNEKKPKNNIYLCFTFFSFPFLPFLIQHSQVIL